MAWMLLRELAGRPEHKQRHSHAQQDEWAVQRHRSRVGGVSLEDC
jgi:hypothetical protein